MTFKYNIFCIVEYICSLEVSFWLMSLRVEQGLLGAHPELLLFPNHRPAWEQATSQWPSF